LTNQPALAGPRPAAAQGPTEAPFPRTALAHENRDCRDAVLQPPELPLLVDGVLQRTVVDPVGLQTLGGEREMVLRIHSGLSTDYPSGSNPSAWASREVDQPG